MFEQAKISNHQYSNKKNTFIFAKPNILLEQNGN
jgi:hypothetical protein